MYIKRLFSAHHPGHQQFRVPRKSRRTDRRQASRLTRRVPGLEPLEDRQLLSANVQKIDVNTNGNGSFPRDFVQVNDTLMFVANIELFQPGRLYTTDGTQGGTVELSADTSFPSVSSNLVQIDDSFFFAGHASGQTELWKTDGTVAGTVLVKDLNPNTSPDGATAYSSYPSYLKNVNGTLFFRANDGLHGTELWASDGTEAGTRLVKDIRPGAAPDGSFTYSSYPASLTSVGGRLFFTADDGTSGLELWTSDGTEAGTVLVKDIRPGGSEDGTVFYGSNPSSLTDLDGILVFAADDGTGGTELWRSDGTADGTVRIKDIHPDAGSSNPSSLINLNGTLYFSADDGVHGGELWRSDGTDAGTTLVRDINPGAAGSAPANLFNFNGTLVFGADDGTNGAELWRSDGTEAGTALVHDINAGSLGSSPRAFLNANGTLYFQADDGPAHGIELWRTDGTSAGTTLAGDFWQGPSSSLAEPLYDADGTIFVRADVAPYGVELWKTDASSDITLVKDIALGTWGSAIGRSIGTPRLVPFKGEMYFSADTCPGCTDFELWKTDGTQAGTAMVKDINPTERNRRTVSDIGSNPRQFVVADDTLYFFANDIVHGMELWKTDGTEAETMLVKDINPGSAGSVSQFGFYDSADLNGQLLFAADDGVHGTELWRSDGTEEGTYMIKDINPNGNASVSRPTRVNDRVFFIADDGIHGVELWSTDGTEAGTVLVKDIFPGTTSTPDGDLPNSSSPFFLINHHGTLYFAADDGTHGSERWTSDGTEAGTAMIADINPGSESSVFGLTFDVNGTAYFRAIDGTHGHELWKTDGTAAGTMMVADINPGPDGSNPGPPPNFANVNGQLYFAADDGTHGVELWRTDGTPGGTVLVSDINPGPDWSIIQGSASRSPQDFVSFDGQLYFHAYDGVHGLELWRSDGTAVGTQLFADVDISDGPPAFFAFGGGGITLLKNAVYVVAAADGFSELFRIDLVPRLPGDADGDDTVDFDDFTILANNFGRDGQFAFVDGDFDADGRVNFSDFLILANNFGRQREMPATAAATATASVQAVDSAFAAAWWEDTLSELSEIQ